MKYRKKLISGILITIMAITMSGCTANAPETTEEVKVSTEAAKEEVPEPVTLTIEQESFNTAFTMEIGESKKLDVETSYEDKLEFVSSNEAIATIDEDGKVTAVKNGMVTMTVCAGDIEKHINVVVKAPVVAEEPEESTDEAETTEATVAATNSETTTQTSNSGTTTGSETTTANTNPSSGAAAPETEKATATTPEEPATEAGLGYNPEDYYLDWTYIQNTVNARLKAEYPNCIIGSSYEIDGYVIQSGYATGNYIDGKPGIWTNDSMVDNIFNSMKNVITTKGGTSESVCGGIGMFVTNITVREDGTRYIEYIKYR